MVNQRREQENSQQKFVGSYELDRWRAPPFGVGGLRLSSALLATALAWALIARQGCGRSGQGNFLWQSTGIGCTRFGQPLTGSVEQGSHVVCRGAGVLQHGHHHRVRQKLLDGGFGLSDVHVDAHSHPKQQGQEARDSRRTGVSRLSPCSFPRAERRVASGGGHCTARFAHSNHRLVGGSTQVTFGGSWPWRLAREGPEATRCTVAPTPCSFRPSAAEPHLGVAGAAGHHA
jgi:hypothetical protein